MYQREIVVLVIISGNTFHSSVIRSEKKALLSDGIKEKSPFLLLEGDTERRKKSLRQLRGEERKTKQVDDDDSKKADDKNRQSGIQFAFFFLR